ncbi:phosphohistidine phosphatase SixA [Herpetosiphon giganteus]|uniref:phosphohistidine phosphatase SixA n=1 Tax=Herpetosiphon giganteus TaxID=2029754 RepID=UPI00195B0002|nr:phosphohistidine phosphatase SixA [Herpetosiphon giganteus]MBM7842283.1 phosphohistidine phosphatase [Herpetosiphon giganteus]
MIFYFVRHGIAEDWAESGLDQDRRLTERGRKRIRQCAQALRLLEIKPDLILSSPLPRAAETASIIAEALSTDPPVHKAQLQPDAANSDFMAECLNAGCSSLMIVGHQPNLSEYVAQLAGYGTNLIFKKGTVCRVEMQGEHGQISWLLAPKVLIALADARQAKPIKQKH